MQPFCKILQKRQQGIPQRLISSISKEMSFLLICEKNMIISYRALDLVGVLHG